MVFQWIFNPQDSWHSPALNAGECRSVADDLAPRQICVAHRIRGLRRWPLHLFLLSMRPAVESGLHSLKPWQRAWLKFLGFGRLHFLSVDAARDEAAKSRPFCAGFHKIVWGISEKFPVIEMRRTSFVRTYPRAVIAGIH